MTKSEYRQKECRTQKLEVSRKEIEAAKSQIRRAGSKASIKLVQLSRQPEVSARLRAVRGSAGLLWVRRILGWCNLAFILSIPLALIYISPWWWALAMAVLIFVLINLIQGEINLELGARLLAVNRKLKLD